MTLEASLASHAFVPAVQQPTKPIQQHPTTPNNQKQQNTPKNNQIQPQLIQAISSALTGLIGAVLGYYFGSSGTKQTPQEKPTETKEQARAKTQPKTSDIHTIKILLPTLLSSVSTVSNSAFEFQTNIKAD